MKFLHVADIHLDYEQYKSHYRYMDFMRAFNWLIDYANHEEVDAFVISGDLFHKRTADPYAMRWVEDAFQALSCPVFIIEGNHEKSYFVDKESWIDYLGATSGVILLDQSCESIKGVRFCGIRYSGAKTNEIVLDFVDSIEKTEEFTVLILHAGLEGQVSHVGKLEEDTMTKIKDKIDYVALGHIHKPYIFDNFVFNPGSPENVSANEAMYPNRGAILVETTDKTFNYEFVVPPRRGFHRINIDVDGFRSPELIYDAVSMLCEDETLKNDVIDLVISGEITFSRSDINTTKIQDMLNESLTPLVVHVRNDATPVGFGITVDESQEKDIEKDVMLQVIRRDARYRDQAELWTAAALTVKDLAIAGETDDIIEFIGGAV